MPLEQDTATLTTAQGVLTRAHTNTLTENKRTNTSWGVELSRDDKSKRGQSDEITTVLKYNIHPWVGQSWVTHFYALHVHELPGPM